MFRKIFFFLIYFTAITATCLFVLCTPITAQQSSTLGIRLSPPIADIILKPNKQVVLAFSIQNSGSSPVEITPVLRQLSADNNGLAVIGTQDLFPDTMSLQNLDKKFGEPFILPAGGKDQLVVRIQAPNTTNTPDLYYTLLLKSKVTEMVPQTVALSQAQAEIGAHILVTVSESGVRNPGLQFEKIDTSTVQDVFQPIFVQAKVKNQSDNLNVIDGHLTIRSLLTNQAVFSINFLPENVLAKSSRTVRGAKKDESDNQSSIGVPLEYKPLALLGPYSIELTLRQPGGDQTIKRTVWMLPISPLLAGFGFSLLLYPIHKHRRWNRNNPIDNL